MLNGPEGCWAFDGDIECDLRDPLMILVPRACAIEGSGGAATLWACKLSRSLGSRRIAEGPEEPCVEVDGEAGLGLEVVDGLFPIVIDGLKLKTTHYLLTEASKRCSYNVQLQRADAYWRCTFKVGKPHKTFFSSP